MNENDITTPATASAEPELQDGGHWTIDALLWVPELIGGVVRAVAWCVLCVVELFG